MFYRWLVSIGRFPFWCLRTWPLTAGTCKLLHCETSSFRVLIISFVKEGGIECGITHSELRATAFFLDVSLFAFSKTTRLFWNTQLDCLRASAGCLLGGRRLLIPVVDDCMLYSIQRRQRCSFRARCNNILPFVPYLRSFIPPCWRSIVLSCHLGCLFPMKTVMALVSLYVHFT